MATNRDFDKFNSGVLSRNDQIAARFRGGQTVDEIAVAMALKAAVIERVLSMYGLLASDES